MRNPEEITLTQYSQAHLAYLAKVKRYRRLILVARVAVLVAIVFLWELSARLGWVDTFAVSSPSRVMATMYRMAADGSLYYHTWITVWETTIGFTVGTLSGAAVAILLWWSNTLSKIMDPYIVVLNSIPKVALGPLFIVWMGNGMPAIIAMALAIAVIVTIMMVYNGFQNVDSNYLKLMQTFGATKGQMLRKVILPASVPTIISALKVNVGMSLVGAIMGEFLVSKAGLGFLIVYGGQVFKMDLIITGVVVLCIVSAFFYYLVSFLENRLLRWQE